MGFFHAFIIVLIAGLATGLGGALALTVRKGNGKFLPVCLSFAAGIMIFLALTELLKGPDMIFFFAGILFIGIVDRLIPHRHSERITPGDGDGELMRTGAFTAAAVSVHNAFEGIAMMVLIQNEPNIAIPMLLAVILHNVPIGAAIALPVYRATSNRIISVTFSVMTGLVMPLSAAACSLLFFHDLNDIVLGRLFAAAAGLMVFIAVDDLLPTAFRHGKRHHVTYGFVLGMAVMAVSLFVLS